MNQHQIEIERNRLAWDSKPLIHAIYQAFYAKVIPHLLPGKTLELGSGLGKIKAFIPQAITSDLYLNPGIDQVESAYKLSFANGSLSNIILIDVWHHLRYPGLALQEFARVLLPGGQVFLIEPAMGYLPRLVYQLLHHEPVAMREPIEWFPKNRDASFDIEYFASQSQAWKMFYQGQSMTKIDQWQLQECAVWSDFAYLLSGGFSKPALYPMALRPAVQMIDKMLTKISPQIFAARMLVRLKKNTD